MRVKPSNAPAKDDDGESASTDKPEIVGGAEGLPPEDVKPALIAAPELPPRRFRVVNREGIDLLLVGGKITLRYGKIVDAVNYDLEALKNNGALLEEVV